MDVEKVFHMAGGTGETSYARNSSLQKKASDTVKHITMEAIEDAYLTATPESFNIADLGCSSGPNTLSIIREMVHAIEGTCRRAKRAAPQFQVYLNDLPGNDFNTIFRALPDFHRELSEGRDGGPSIYIGGYPGSFYGRLFPNKCLHFVHSSNSLHWLSRVPPAIFDDQGRSINRANIYISESSPPQVSEAYFRQFQEDFSLFLRSRSEELISGGRMVLILLGREGSDHVDRGNSLLWDLLSQSFAILVSQGEVEEEKLESYNAHFYAPSENELEEEVRREGSFKMERLEMFEMDKRVGGNESYGMAVAKAVRAIQESMICHHFGEGVADKLFHNFGRMVDEEMAKDDIRPTITFALVLRKL